MIFKLFRRSPGEHSIARLYGAIVAQARAEPFYRDYGVPDSVNGRFEMIVLHLVLLLHRLGREPQPLRRSGQAVFDLFCRDMDANLREIGVGDLAVPRQMQRIGEAFYGRQAAYEAALASADPQALAAALARNVFGASEPSCSAERLAAYMRAALRHLFEREETTLSEGAVSFPEPGSISLVGDRQPEDAR
jgi:cytochrome b pre-mRNA-processing protein 3